MSPFIFALVALRLVAVYVVAQILFQLTYLVTFLVGPDAQVDSMHIWLVYGSCVVFGVGLWWLAPMLARKAASIPESNAALGNWTAADVQRVALSLMGIWFIVQALPTIVFQLLSHVNRPDEVESSGRFLIGIVPGTVEFLLGLLLVLGASFWSELLVRVQEFGLRGKKLS